MENLNKYAVAVAAVVILTLVLAIPLGLRFSHATLLFGFVAVLSAPLVIHRIESATYAIAFLVVLAGYASYPLKKLLQIDGALGEIGVSFAYIAVLWVVGSGWKRSWS